MASMQDTLESGVREAQKIVDEYRERIAQAFEAERERLKRLAELESNRIVAGASQKSEAIVDAARKEAEQIVIITKNKADEELSKKLAQAQKQAEQIVRDAEGKAEKIAREKTKHEIQRIIAEAKEQSERTIAHAREAANSESDSVRAKANEEAEQLTKVAQGRAFTEAQEESAKIINGAKHKAELITTYIANHGTRQVVQRLAEIVAKAEGSLETEITQLLADATQRMKEIIEETGTEVESEFGRLAKIVAEAENELGRVAETAEKETRLASEPGGEQLTSTIPPKEQVEIVDCPAKTETSVVPAESPDSELYKGQLNLEINAPFTYAQLDSLRESLGRVPGLTLLSTSGSMDGETPKAVYTINIRQPLPLPRILKEMRPIKSVGVRKNNIAIALKQD